MFKRLKNKRLLFILGLVFGFTGCYTQTGNFKNYNRTLYDLLLELNIDSTKLSIRIDKSEYKLSVLYKGDIIKEYPVVFGPNPVDDKLMQGDGCTPEGTFHIKSKYPHKSWSRFVWIDYPNKDSWEKHNKAKAEGKIPKNAKIGGEIGIHGVPRDSDFIIGLKYNWTLGCISLKNKDVEEIYPYINEKTIIQIQK